MECERAFTTFQAAKICKVFHTTIINWVNKGKLKARFTPGGHRRIAASDLIAFMRAWDMPIPADLLSCPKRALVVDDDPAMQRMMLRALQPIADLESQSCGNGLEALMLIGKEAPDLLLLDIHIPQVNGLELCRLLKANPHTQGVRILAVTGAALSKKDEEEIVASAEALLRKPLSVDVLRRAAKDLLEPPVLEETRA